MKLNIKNIHLSDGFKGIFDGANKIFEEMSNLDFFKRTVQNQYEDRETNFSNGDELFVEIDDSEFNKKTMNGKYLDDEDAFEEADKIFIDFDNMISNFDDTVKKVFQIKKKTKERI